MSKKYYDEDGNEVTNVQEVKPWYKRWWVWSLLIILLIAFFGGADEATTENTGGTQTGDVTNESAGTDE